MSVVWRWCVFLRRNDEPAYFAIVMYACSFRISHLTFFPLFSIPNDTPLLLILVVLGEQLKCLEHYHESDWNMQLTNLFEFLRARMYGFSTVHISLIPHNHGRLKKRRKKKNTYNPRLPATTSVSTLTATTILPACACALWDLPALAYLVTFSTCRFTYLLSCYPARPDAEEAR